MYDIERYLNIRSAYGASFSSNGETLSFLMDTTGTSQVWSIEGQGRWPEQHTFFDERVTFASWSPERRELAFGMDEGGDERDQLYLLVPDAGEVTNLTRQPDAKHWWGGWSHDGERFAFTSNRRDNSVFDVYVQARDAVGNDCDAADSSAVDNDRNGVAAAAELVYEGDGWLNVGGWSPDDTRLIVTESYSNFDQDVSIVDVESGELTHLTPHDGTIRFQSVTWGPNGENLYLATDAEADTLYLARLNIDSRELTVVEEGGEWELDGVAIDQDTGRLVYSRNVDGYTELTTGRLVEADSIETFPTPDLPDGLAGGVSFAPDADRFALTVTGSADNTNVYVVETETGEADRWTAAATAGIPRETFVEPELVRYPTFDGRQIPAFFTLPQTDTGHGETPVIVDIHGGPESQRRPSFSGVKQYLVRNGYAVFEPNVRGSAGYGKAYGHLDDVEKRMDSVKDIEAGVEWLHDHPAVDPNRIVAMGGSYGGFMVLASLTEYPELWAAGIDIVGIANFVTFLENTGDWRRELREAEYGSLEDDREFLESISPSNNIDAIQTPLFVLHGENDPRVPVGEAEQIVEKVREQGVPVRKLIFEDEGHGFSKLGNRVEAYTEIVEFLDRHV